MSDLKPFPDWLTAVRALLPAGTEWTDDDTRCYHREGYAPDETVAELRFRDLAAS